MQDFVYMYQVLDHILIHLDGNLDFHQTNLWAKPCIFMFLPLALQNRNSFYSNAFVNCVEQTKITQ
jgi:hypothetical protein